MRSPSYGATMIASRRLATGGDGAGMGMFSDPELEALNAEAAPHDLVFRWEGLQFGVVDSSGESIKVIRPYILKDGQRGDQIDNAKPASVVDARRWMTDLIAHTDPEPIPYGRLMLRAAPPLNVHVRAADWLTWRVRGKAVPATFDTDVNVSIKPGESAICPDCEGVLNSYAGSKPGALECGNCGSLFEPVPALSNS